MSELQSGGGAGAAAFTEWDEDVVSVEHVQELFSTLAKALRAYQLYEENNPVRQRFLDALRKAFARVWEDTRVLTLGVQEDRICLGKMPVYESDNRSDSLAFLFFKDGVREITFLPGLAESELERFLGVLQKARKLRPEGDDLLTVLWEADLVYFQYRYIDFLAEGVELPTAGPGNDQQELQGVLQGELGEEEQEDDAAAAAEGGAEEAAPKAVSKDDFNPTLYALDPREMKALREELGRELGRDLRMDVLSALFDRLEEPSNRERQTEILGILATLLPNFLSRGQIGPATHVLHELRKLESTPGVFDEDRQAESSGILDEVSRPEFITELIQALYDGTIRASPKQLATLLQFLRAGALAPLLRASETVEHKELQAVLRQATKGIAERNRGAVVRLLTEGDAVVASAAARMAGELQIAEAGPALAGLLTHAEPSVRLAAVEAAVALKASTVAGALQHTLGDPDREVRIAAARALGELRYGPAGTTLAEIVGGKDIRGADITEKVAMFEAYGRVAGEKAVAVLDKLLNGKGFLGKREPAEVRAAAALALGTVEGPAAAEALRSAADTDDPVVRSAVNRAMRREG